MKSLRNALLATTALLCVSTAALAQQNGTPQPSNSLSISIPPVHSTANEASHIIKTGAGNVYSAYVTNAGATAGHVIVVDSATVPGTGALTGSTVLDCVTLPASGSVSLNYGPFPPEPYSNGITIVLSSDTSCFIFTNGTITGYIHGSAP